jgi:hypothetical protein
MRAAANLTVRSPRAYYLCLRCAGITPESRVNGGNCLTSPSNWQRRQVGDSEVAGSCAFGLGALVHTVWTVLACDVAEATFRSARHSGGRLVGRQAADQCSQVLYKLVVHSFRRYADRVVQVRRLRYSDSSVTVAEANRAIDGCRNSLSCSKSAFFG